MKVRILIAGAIVGCAALCGCRVIGHKPPNQTSTLGRQMSGLKSQLDGRELTLDEYEQSKQEILQGDAHPSLTNAR